MPIDPERKDITILKVIDSSDTNKLDSTGVAEVLPGKLIVKGMDPSVPVSGVIIKDQNFPAVLTRSADVVNAPSGVTTEFSVTWDDYRLGDPGEKQTLKIENTLNDIEFGQVTIILSPVAFAAASTTSTSSLAATTSVSTAPAFYLAGPKPDATGRFFVPRHFVLAVDHHKDIHALAVAYPIDGELELPGQFTRDGVELAREKVFDDHHRRTVFAFWMAPGATHVRVVVKKKGQESVRETYFFRLEN